MQSMPSVHQVPAASMDKFFESVAAHSSERKKEKPAECLDAHPHTQQASLRYGRGNLHTSMTGQLGIPIPNQLLTLFNLE